MNTRGKETRALDAKRIKARQMSGAAVSMCLMPSRGPRDDIVLRGGKPKDHSKENYQRIKKIQQVNKIKQEEELLKQPPQVFKMKQFQNVPPKLKTQPISKAASDPDLNSRPSTASSTGSNGRKNFIRHNVDQAREQRSLKLPSISDKPSERTTKLGEVPKYLVNRKLHWAEEEQKRQERIERALIPEGTSLVPEIEKKDIIAKLTRLRDSLIAELCRFPVTAESAKYRRKRAELESKIREVEEGISLFSKKKVFIPNGDYIPGVGLPSLNVKLVEAARVC
ncbi:calmodulin-binding-domain-containing protein [Cladochytrium replicatum]|nr:calmodulin-binding-domain-containing protein [Cladochytrium replicatum]